METKEKKQVLAAIQKATNILVTVGVSPTVDELSALLGLSLVLGKLDKHATAVFSGSIPPAISFLEPDKTFEDTVDGLRDFIIALNKDKADHLRYKLDGDVVKIFITPYKNTIIRDTDLEFSQGDFNVDLILALGVENKADLDSAVSSHGRILHDATTVSLSAGSKKSDLGEIDWHANNASGLSEMAVSLSRDLGDNLIDEQIATALMTGIVSQTERFSNNLTTSDVMKTAASLMVLGANQQLIAARLEEAEEKPVPEPQPVPAAAPAPAPEPEEEDAVVNADGSMQINHTHDDEKKPEQPVGPSLAEVERHKDEILQEELDKVIPSAAVDLDELKNAEPEPTAQPHVGSNVDQGETRRFIAKATGYDDMEEPSMGGTLNATTEQAEEDSRSALEADRNRVILSHNAPPAKPLDEPDAPAPAPELYPEPIPIPEPVEEPEVYQAPVEPEPKPAPALKPEPTPAPKPEPKQAVSQPSVEEALATLGYPAGSHPTLADLDQKTGHTGNALEVDDARAAVANALDSVFSPANNPTESVGSQPLGGDLHESNTPAPTLASPTIAPPVAIQPPVEPASTAISLPPLPPLPPLPGQAGALPPLPPLPDVSELDAHESERAPQPDESAAPSENDWQQHTVEPPTNNDPTQFRIPGQK